MEKKISRENLIISKHTVVCVKHFKEEDIIRNDIRPGKNGDPDIVIPRKRIKLKADAVPLIFSNLPNYLSDSKKLASRTSPSKRKRCFEEYQNAKQDKWINLDSIKSYQDFTNKISNWIKQFPDINIQVKSEYVLLYKISKFDSLNFDICPSLPFCVKIDSSLHILVWKNNIMITPSELSWLNLQCGLLNHWSQLENLLI